MLSAAETFWNYPAAPIQLTLDLVNSWTSLELLELLNSPNSSTHASR